MGTGRLFMVQLLSTDDIRLEFLLSQDSPSRRPDIIHGHSVNIGPHHTRDQRIESIKEEPENRVFRSHMLQKQESSTLFADSSKLSEPFHRVRNRTEHEGGEDRVEDLVREGKTLLKK